MHTCSVPCTSWRPTFWIGSKQTHLFYSISQQGANEHTAHTHVHSTAEHGNSHSNSSSPPTAIITPRCDALSLAMSTHTHTHSRVLPEQDVCWVVQHTRVYAFVQLTHTRAYARNCLQMRVGRFCMAWRGRGSFIHNAVCARQRRCRCRRQD